MLPLPEPSLEKYIKWCKPECPNTYMYTVPKLVLQLLLSDACFVDCVGIPIALFPLHNLQTGRGTVTQNHEQATCA